MIEPGYYWIRWPSRENRFLREWTVGRVRGNGVEIVGSGWSGDTQGAELGPRIEPPRDEK
jgi:hypothetical protein